MGDRLIDKAERGERITKADSPFVLFDTQIDAGRHDCHWRDVVCSGKRDVLECMHCGRQMVAGCNFDDDYA